MLIDFTQPAHNFVILSAALAESKDLRTSKSVRSYHYFDAFGIGSAKIPRLRTSCYARDDRIFCDYGILLFYVDKHIAK